MTYLAGGAGSAKQVLEILAPLGEGAEGRVVLYPRFGLGHLNGYPPGWTGAVLSGVFGLALGVLRRYSGGLLAPVIAHVSADATIISILAWETGG